MDLSELIEQTDIVEYISQFVDLERRGEEYWALSPFTDEKTPSFSVRPYPPVWYDYSSGRGGNVLTFIKYYNQCSGREAIDILRKYNEDEGETEVFTPRLSATKTCRRFMKQKRTQKRSKTSTLAPNCMEKYERKDDKLIVWEEEGISRASLERFQVRYDGYSNRLVYPIRNTKGDIVNIGGRTLDPLWKEKKMRKYNYLYPWGTIDTIFGIAENRKFIEQKKEIILFEGCKSVLLADTWNIKNTGAILTSHLSPNQMKILAKLGCRAVFALDNDIDVRKDRNIARLKQYINVEFIKDTNHLLDCKDSPVDKGRDTFRKLYEQHRYRL